MHAFGIGLPASTGLQVFDADFSPAISGVPASGFMAYNIIDAHAQPGRLANYGGAFAHRATFACEGPAGECGEPPLSVR